MTLQVDHHPTEGAPRKAVRRQRSAPVSDTVEDTGATDRAVLRIGAVTGMAGMLATIFPVQMAVDGVAFGSAMETWASATGAEQSSAFQVAEGIRGLEKELSAFFHVSNGTTLLALGLSVALGHLYARWLGGVAVLAGVAFLVGGAITGHSGFFDSSGVFLTPALLLMVVLVSGICFSMWRRAAGSSSSR
jgi:hypothetical protein